MLGQDDSFGGNSQRHFANGQPIHRRELMLAAFGRSGHSAERFVVAIKPLPSDSCQRQRLAGDAQRFASFHRLMKSIRPGSILEDSSRRSINDLHFIVANDIVHIALEDMHRSQGQHDVLVPGTNQLRVHGHLFVRVNTFKPGIRSVEHCRRQGSRNSRSISKLFGNDAGFAMHVGIGRFTLSATAEQQRAKRRRRSTRDRSRQRLPRTVRVAAVLARCVSPRSREYKRCPELLGADSIQGQLIAQIVESECMPRTVGDVGLIRGASLVRRMPFLAATRWSCRAVRTPARAAGNLARQIAVRCRHVDASARQRLNVGRHRDR